MKLEDTRKVNPLHELNTTERRCFVIAVIMAFAAIFVWFFKILFF